MQHLITNRYRKARNLSGYLWLRAYFFILINRKRLIIHRKRCIIYSGGERYDGYRKCPSRFGKCNYNLGWIHYIIPIHERQLVGKGVGRKLYSLYTHHNTMDKKFLQLLITILAVLSWIRVYFSQDILSIVASIVITVALACVILKKR